MNKLLKTAHLFVLLAVGVSVVKAQAQQTFFEDQFNGSSLDTNNNWTFYGPLAEGGDGNVDVITGSSGGNGGTNFGFKPTIESDPDGTRYAHLRMDTYNPRRSGTLKGTEMYSLVGFGPPSNAPRGRVYDVKDQPNEISTGFEFESRIRYVDNTLFPHKGGVAAFWTYWNHSSDYNVNSSGYKAHEIDYEMFYQSSYANRRLNLQNYRDFNASGTNAYSDSRITAHAYPPYVPDWNQWNYVKIVWTPKGNGEWRTQWYVKRNLNDSYGNPIGEEATVAPNKWMTVRFNIWGHTTSNDVQPTSDSNNRSYFLDVDWVKVTKVGAVAPASVSVSEVSGVSAPNGKTVPNLAVVKGQVSDASQTASQVNVVITRARDGYKWRGFGTPAWVAPDQPFGASTDYPATQPTWTTNGVMPSGSNLESGSYTIYADVLANGVTTSSAPVTVNVVSNAVPVSQGFTPSSGSNSLNSAYGTNTIYTDADGSADIVECALEIRHGSDSTQAFYNKPQNKLYLLNDSGQRIGGFAPESVNTISNRFLTLDCRLTTVFESVSNKQVQVRWNLTPKVLLVNNAVGSTIPTNDILMDVTDSAGAHEGFVNRATWMVSNNVPAPVSFAPPNGSSRLGNPYSTIATYTDANGADDIFYCYIEIRHGSNDDATRAWYNVKYDRLYLLSNDGHNFVGGYPAGSQNMISNDFVTLDCFQTKVYINPANQQVQVGWNFTPKARLVGTNQINLDVYDLTTAHPGYRNMGTWTVTNPTSALSSGAVAMGTTTQSNPTTSTATADKGQRPALGEMPYNSRTANAPNTIESDGATGPPESTDLSTTAQMNSASTTPGAQAAPSSAAAVQKAPPASGDPAPSGQTS